MARGYSRPHKKSLPLFSRQLRAMRSPCQGVAMHAGGLHEGAGVGCRDVQGVRPTLDGEAEPEKVRGGPCRRTRRAEAGAGQQGAQAYPARRGSGPAGARVRSGKHDSPVR